MIFSILFTGKLFPGFSKKITCSRFQNENDNRTQKTHSSQRKDILSTWLFLFSHCKLILLKIWVPNKEEKLTWAYSANLAVIITKFFCEKLMHFKCFSDQLSANCSVITGSLDYLPSFLVAFILSFLLSY